MLAAAVAAYASTASGALIASVQLPRPLPLLKRMVGRGADHSHDIGHGNPEHDVRSNQIYVVVLGVVATLIFVCSAMWSRLSPWPTTSSSAGCSSHPRRADLEATGAR